MTKTKPLSLSPTIKTDNVKFRQMPRRGSMYDQLFARMSKLTAGKSLMVDVPKGTSPRTMHNRINAAMRRIDLKAPKGCDFIKRTTDDGRIAISCESAW
jgi:hypothetical protein